MEISILGLDLWYDTTFVQPDTFLQHWYWKIQRFGEVGAIQCPTASVTSHIMTTYNNLRCLAAKSCTDRSPWRRLTTAALVSYWQLTNIASYVGVRRDASDVDAKPNLASPTMVSMFGYVWLPRYLQEWMTENHKSHCVLSRLREFAITSRALHYNLFMSIAPISSRFLARPLRRRLKKVTSINCSNGPDKNNVS